MNPTETRILLIEDDAFIGNLASTNLAKAGLIFTHVTSAEEARREIEKSPPNLILLDLVLPGKDGFTFLEELKKDEKTKLIPVIIVSNLGSKEEINRGMLLGADTYFVKSNTMPDEIIRRIREKLKIP